MLRRSLLQLVVTVGSRRLSPVAADQLYSGSLMSATVARKARINASEFTNVA